MRSALFFALLLGSAWGCAATREAVDRARSGAAYAVHPGAAVGLFSGRDHAEGPAALWLVDERGVYSLGGAAPTLVWKAPRFATVLHGEAADLDGDGVTEWIVVLDAGRIRSEVIGLKDGARVRVGAPWFGYARPALGMPDPGLLLVQKAGGDRPFWGPPSFARWTAEGIEPAAAISVQDGVSLFDLFWLPVDGRSRLFTGEQSGQIAERHHERTKEVLWRSEDRPWGRPVVLDREYRDLLGETREEGVGLATAPLVGDLDGDNVAEVWIAGHPLPPVRMFESLTGLPGGDVRRLDAASRGLDERIRSALVGRAIVGVAAIEHGGRTVIAAAVWTRLRGGFERPETRVLLFDPVTGDQL